MHAVFDLAEENDASLATFVGAAGPSTEDQALAEQAMQLLFERHFPYLRGILEKFADSVGTIVIDPEEMAIATFKKAASSQFADESGGCSENARKQVRAWLGRIAINLAKDELRRHARKPLIDVLDGELNVPEPITGAGDSHSSDPRVRAALQAELDKLSDVDRDVVMTYANLGVRTSTGGLELSSEDRLALESRTGLERDTLRQRKRRIFRRLNEALNAVLMNNPLSHAVKHTRLSLGRHHA